MVGWPPDRPPASTPPASAGTGVAFVRERMNEELEKLGAVVLDPTWPIHEDRKTQARWLGKSAHRLRAAQRRTRPELRRIAELAKQIAETPRGQLTPAHLERLEALLADR